MPTINKVRLTMGVNDYACIIYDKGTMNVLLMPERSASESMRETANEMRMKAQKALERAQLIEQAAEYLELKGD
jgi:uncharacterized protein (UPF0276 family)